MGPGEQLFAGRRNAGRTFHDELYQVATDGSLAVRRYAHHFSVYDDDYYASPRADISRDGRFAAFTSNWGVAGGRKDVFILKLR